MKNSTNLFFGAVVATSIAASFALTSFADHNTPEAMDKRTAPVGTLTIEAASTATTAAAAGPRDAKTVYNLACMACHGTGAAGAPKTGDAAAWAPRIEKGVETLVDHAINGFQGENSVMPPRGGNPTLTDEEVTAAVEYIIEQSQ